MLPLQQSNSFSVSPGSRSSSDGELPPLVDSPSSGDDGVPVDWAAIYVANVWLAVTMFYTWRWVTIGMQVLS